MGKIMNRKIIALLVLFLVSYNVCLGQLKLQAIAAFDYSYGIATGGLHKYIPGKAFDGVHMHWRYFFKRNFSLGLSTGWNNFRTELPRSVYETDKGTVSAVQTRYFHSCPIIVTGYYYLRSLHYVMPYAGGAAGAYLTRYEKYYGVVPMRDRDINPGIRPEIGVVVPFKNSGLGLIVGGRYNMIFYSHEEVNNLQYFEAAVGLYFGYPVFSDSFLKDEQ